MKSVGVKDKIVSLGRSFKSAESAGVSDDIEKEKFISDLIFLKKMVVHVVTRDNGLRAL